MFKIVNIFSLVFLLLFSGSSYALDIMVLGLFGNMAIIKIDGKQRKLKVGQSSPEGVKLVAVDSSEAVLQYKNKRQSYRLGSFSSFGGGNDGDDDKPKKQQTATIHQFNSMFVTTGSINKIPVKFLVDTGASMVAMSVATARRIGINYRYKGKPGIAGTASGTARMYSINLERVKVGDIVLHNVEGAVIEGKYAGEVLLGRSFLKRVHMITEKERLILKKK